VFVFGEKKCYKKAQRSRQSPGFPVEELKIPLIVFWGRFGTWYPFKARQTVVFGAPIETTFNDAVDEDDEKRAERLEKHVDRLHATYCDAVAALFEKHKAFAGYGPEESLTVA
jgi:2-acylglycerol O-acyltransferase 2